MTNPFFICWVCSSFTLGNSQSNKAIRAGYKCTQQFGKQTRLHFKTEVNRKAFRLGVLFILLFDFFFLSRVLFGVVFVSKCSAGYIIEEERSQTLSQSRRVVKSDGKLRSLFKACKWRLKAGRINTLLLYNVSQCVQLSAMNSN